MKLNEYAKAHKDFDQVIALVPENPEYLSSKAQCFLSEGLNEDLTMHAIALLEKALEQDESHIESILLLA